MMGHDPKPSTGVSAKTRAQSSPDVQSERGEGQRSIDAEGQRSECEGQGLVFASSAMSQQQMLGLPVSPGLEAFHAGLHGSVSAPMSPDSPRYHAPTALSWSHRAASVPSQVTRMGELMSAHASEGGGQPYQHIPNIVIEQVSARDAFGHSRTPPFVSSSWSSPWQLHLPPPRKGRANSDSALYDVEREHPRPQEQPPLALHAAHSVGSVSDAIHLEQIRITDSPCFSPAETPTSALLPGTSLIQALRAYTSANTPSPARLVSSTSSAPTYHRHPDAHHDRSRAKSDSEATVAREEHDPVAMETGGGSPPRISPLKVESIRRNFSSPVDLPQSNLRATGSLFQRRFHPMPMEISSDNNGNNNHNNHHQNGHKSKPRIAIETSDNDYKQESDNPHGKDHDASQQAHSHADDPNRLQVSRSVSPHTGEAGGDGAATLSPGGDSSLSSEQVPHSPKTAWLRRHSDSKLQVEQASTALHVSQEAQHRSHSTGENIKSSISDAVEETPPTPTVQRSSDPSDWSSKRIKVKQYLAKRYELDLESPKRLLSIESDDVFSPSPGVFTKSKAFSFSPERERQHAAQHKAAGHTAPSAGSVGRGAGYGDSRSSSSGGEAPPPKDALDVSPHVLQAQQQRQRKIAREPLYIRTDDDPPDTPLSFVGGDTEEVETPVFFSPAPTSASSPYHSTVFQFNPRVLDRTRTSLERNPIPMSPLASGQAKSRSPSHKPRLSPVKSVFSQPKSPTHTAQSYTSHSPAQLAAIDRTSVRQSEAAISSRDISVSSGTSPAHFHQISTQHHHSTTGSISLDSRISMETASRLPMDTSDCPPPRLPLDLPSSASGMAESKSRERSPASSPSGREGSPRDHRQLPLSPREIMPTIREHSQAMEIPLRPSEALPPPPQPQIKTEADTTSSHASSRSFPPSPTAVEMSGLRAHAAAPDSMFSAAAAAAAVAAAGGGILPVMPPLASMLHHPSFAHSSQLAAAQHLAAAARTAAAQQPFQSYLTAAAAANAPTAPGLQEMMQWATPQTSSHHAHHPPSPRHSSASPTTPRTRHSTSSTSEASPPQPASHAPSSTGSKKPEDPGGGTSGGGKTLDASKIIYCPFSEEVKQQRYQQDPNQNFVCPVCGQMFPSFNYLANHMVNHLPSETITKGPGDGNKIHICKVCNKSFSRSDMLTRHMRLHTGLRPYECRICGQVFSRSDHLHTHNRTHTGEKPYHCPHCPYAAPRRDMITRHMRIHMKQWPKRGRSRSTGGSTGSSDTQQSSSFSSSQESGECEGPRRQSHSLSSMESVESPGLGTGIMGSSSLDLPGAGPRHSLSVMEHRSLELDSIARQRQWSVASGESYEASDERTPSTPGSANRFFTHQWQQAHMGGSSQVPPPGGDQPHLASAPGTSEHPPSSPKKRQWSEMSQVEMGDETRGFSTTATLRDYSPRRDVLPLRVFPKYSTESSDTADTERTLGSVSSFSELSQGSLEWPGGGGGSPSRRKPEVMQSQSGRSQRSSSGSDLTVQVSPHTEGHRVKKESMRD